MSSTLYWIPVQPPKKSLSDELKFALRKRYGEPVDYVLCSKDIEYLLGLRDGGCDDFGVAKLVRGIQKFGQIQIIERC